MTEQSPETPATVTPIKIQRQRRRLYQAAPEPASEPVPAPAPEPHSESEASPEIQADSPTEIADALSPESEQMLTAEQRMRRERAQTLVQYHSAIAGSVGVMPLPWLDLVVVSAVQLRMLRRLTRLYEIEFSSQRVKVLIAALIGGTQSALVVASLSKYIPAVGPAVAGIPAGLAAGATTYALGRVFMAHFETGGNLIDFDPEKLDDYFREQLKKRLKRD